MKSYFEKCDTYPKCKYADCNCKTVESQLEFAEQMKQAKLEAIEEVKQRREKHLKNATIIKK